MNIVNTYHRYPDLSGLGAAFLTVLTRSDGDGTYAVYSGVVALPDTSDPSYAARRSIAAVMVKLHGDKEAYERAVTFFPMLRQEEYRA